MSDENKDQPQASEPKKPYHKPVLVDYGSVAAITLGSLSKQTDGASGFSMT